MAEIPYKEIAIGGATFAVCEWASEKLKGYNKYAGVAPGILAVIGGIYGVKGSTGKTIAIAGGISVIENILEVFVR